MTFQDQAHSSNRSRPTDDPSLRSHQRGAVIVEYVLILTLVSIPVFLALGVFMHPAAQVAQVDGHIAADPAAPLGSP